MAALKPDEKVVLVGHSMGGIAISAAMEKFPQKVAVGIYVTAFMPTPPFNLLDLNKQEFNQVDKYMDSKLTYDNGTNNPPTSVLFGLKFSSSTLYQLSPPEDLTLALGLVRPFPIYRDQTSLKQATLSKENYGSVRRAYIVIGQDKAILPDKQQSMIRNYPPDEVKVIAASDHMVMFSQPLELSLDLQEIAQKYY